MSLLSRGTDTVTVFDAVPGTDSDGNLRTVPSSVGVVYKAVVQPMTASTEDDSIGFESATKYRLRLIGFSGELGSQAQIEWRGERWAVFGEPMRFNGSPLTAHTDYVIERR